MDTGSGGKGREKRLTRRCHEEADSGRPVHTCNWKHGCRVQEAEEARWGRGEREAERFIVDR